MTLPSCNPLFRSSYTETTSGLSLRGSALCFPQFRLLGFNQLWTESAGAESTWFRRSIIFHHLPQWTWDPRICYPRRVPGSSSLDTEGWLLTLRHTSSFSTPLLGLQLHTLPKEESGTKNPFPVTWMWDLVVGFGFSHRSPAIRPWVSHLPSLTLHPYLED